MLASPLPPVFSLREFLSNGVPLGFIKYGSREGWTACAPKVGKDTTGLEKYQ
jgi:hypothetical protein